jgi:hypothetical protein
MAHTTNTGWIGMDESGKGDYFGPLAATVVYLEPTLEKSGAVFQWEKSMGNRGNRYGFALSGIWRTPPTGI